MTLEIIGAPQSSLVRAARIAAHEKGVAYELTPARPHSPEVDAIHPLGLIPVMRHGDVALGESAAIARYIDREFEGPALMPPGGAALARAEQWLSSVVTSIDRLMVRDYLLPYLFARDDQGEVIRTKIDEAAPKLGAQFAALEAAVGGGGWLAGRDYTLAGAFLAPIIDYVRNFPEAGTEFGRCAALGDWFGRVSARASFEATVPPPVGG